MKTKEFFFIVLISFLSVSIFAQHVGIGTVSPPQRLTIEGKLQVGDDMTSPTEGAIRYNDVTNDFEGWTGSEWKSFTFNQADISTAYTDPNASTFSYIGHDVDASLYFAVAGSLAHDKVDVFAKTNNCWGWQYSISNNLPSNTPTDNFGQAVDMFGGIAYETIAVGAPGNDHHGLGAGMAGVYHVDNTATTFLYSVAPPDISAGDEFGRSMSGSGNYIAISSPFDDDVYNNSGSVYIFRHQNTGAAMVQKIVSPQVEANGQFGYKVVMSGSDLLIYARGEGGWTYSGKVYHYVWNNLNQIFVFNQAIGNPQPGNYRYFGASMDADGDHLMIGISTLNQGVNDGGVFYYKKNTTTNMWGNTQTISGPYTSDDDNFGTGIAVDREGKLVVSAPGYDAKGKNAGALFLFEYDGSLWNLSKTLTVGDSRPNGKIGSDIAAYSIKYDQVIIGSPQWNNQTGAVHFLKAK